MIYLEIVKLRKSTNRQKRTNLVVGHFKPFATVSVLVQGLSGQVVKEPK